MTDEELGAEYVRVMGSDLGQLCGELRDDVDWLRRKWSNFQELFGKGQERIDLLNRAASNFFYFLHRLFFEDAMLHLCRLSDPPKTTPYLRLPWELKRAKCGRAASLLGNGGTSDWLTQT